MSRQLELPHRRFARRFLCASAIVVIGLCPAPAAASQGSSDATAAKVERARVLIERIQSGDAKAEYKLLSKADRALVRWGLTPGPLVGGYYACGDDPSEPVTHAQCYEPLPNATADAGAPDDLSFSTKSASELLASRCKSPSKIPAIWMSSVVGIKLIDLKMDWHWCWEGNRITSATLTPIPGTPGPVWDFDGWVSKGTTQKGPEGAFALRVSVAKYRLCFIHCIRTKQLWLSVKVLPRGGYKWKGGGG